MRMKIDEFVDTSKIYHSNFDGDFKIIKLVGKPQRNGAKRVMIEWLSNHHRQEVTIKDALSGNVKNRLLRKVKIGDIYHSANYGDFVVIDFADVDKPGYFYKIRFINTGSEKIVRGSDMLSGYIKDNYLRTIFGVACHGDMPEEIKYRDTDITYKLWYNMLVRCYDIRSKDFEAYGNSGVRVCDRWLIYSNFLEDIVFIPGYNEWVLNPSGYNLDKDYRQLGIPDNKKVYSLETCAFVKNSYNFALANLQRCYKFGVFFEDGVYKALLIINAEPIFIGAYPTEEMASAAYINAFKIYTGYTPITNVAPCDLSEIVGKNLNAKIMCTKV